MLQSRARPVFDVGLVADWFDEPTAFLVLSVTALAAVLFISSLADTT